MKTTLEKGMKKVPICHYCTRPATTKDHIVPKARGGVNAEWNYVPACEPCNTAKASDCPTCTCFKCAYAVGMWHEGHRGKTAKAVRAKVRRKDGVWVVMVPDLPRKSKRATFRTLKAAHNFAMQG